MEARINKISLAVLLFGIMLSPLVDARESSQQIEQSYGSYIGTKLGTGLANMATGWIEIPKNTINLTNQADYVFFGFIGGMIKGTLHTVGRTMTGVLDVITFPLPTKPMIRSGLVWNNFGANTTYGPYFQLRDTD